MDVLVVTIVEGLTARLRKFDAASHAAFWASQSFSPLVAPRHVHGSILRIISDLSARARTQDVKTGH
jgi:hypothetical protein